MRRVKIVKPERIKIKSYIVCGTCGQIYSVEEGETIAENKVCHKDVWIKVSGSNGSLSLKTIIYK